MNLVMVMCGWFLCLMGFHCVSLVWSAQTKPVVVRFRVGALGVCSQIMGFLWHSELYLTVCFFNVTY